MYFASADAGSVADVVRAAANNRTSDTAATAATVALRDGSVA